MYNYGKCISGPSSPPDSLTEEGFISVSSLPPQPEKNINKTDKNKKYFLKTYYLL